MKSAAIIVAAGRGRRMGGTTPKQYIPLHGPCALRRSVDRFLQVPEVTTVLPVIHADDASLCAAALEGADAECVFEPVMGGATRAASDLNGLSAMEKPKLRLASRSTRYPPMIASENATRLRPSANLKMINSPADRPIPVRIEGTTRGLI